ncbi:uncharacterized protein B0I36DRAFT_408735 [Microdochium trichocladiopsis]|uniref:Uncharacterized protein n=1 Tax=Microdochium trichocladiopsis TaxID=1682393 RepID=A0A9P8Y6J6_9PEZI|nr:uncharacterized protein B0I36DRAFT_408735 [Microdochium trichocladiopsis]KAH7030623.1 hypothetical protein B0I36DRAFT_408735 [Microdochium trichocladiopsis]
MTPEAPTKDVFDQAVWRAHFVLRKAEEDSLGLIMPYSAVQLDQAVKYFTQSNDGSGGLDTLAWEWAYEDIIVRRSRGWYTRAWAPERVRPGAAISGMPETLRLRISRSTNLGSAKHGESAETPGSGAFLAAGMSSSSPPNFFWSNPVIILNSFPASPSTVTDEPPALPNTPLQQHYEDRESLRAQMDSQHLEQKIQDLLQQPLQIGPQTPTQASSQPHDYQERHGRGHGQREARSPCEVYPISSGTRAYLVDLRANPHWRFVGFHREQVHVAGRHIHPGRDYRQAVHCVRNPRSRPHYRLRRFNMAGEDVPRRYRINPAQIRKDHVLFREDPLAQDCPIWIPTPVDPRWAGRNEEVLDSGDEDDNENEE